MPHGARLKSCHIHPTTFARRGKLAWGEVGRGGAKLPSLIYRFTMVLRVMQHQYHMAYYIHHFYCALITTCYHSICEKYCFSVIKLINLEIRKMQTTITITFQ